MFGWETECNLDAKLTTFEKVCGGLAILWPLVGVLAVCSLLTVIGTGCKSFYENSGSRTRVGTLTAPVEISDGTDSLTAKLLYSMDGADVYVRKDSKVTVVYDNVYTNTYIGCVNTRGFQHLRVEVEPLYIGDDCGGETNAVTNCATDDTK